jgi:hypothetical protein
MPIPGGSRATRKLSFSVGLVSINALAVTVACWTSQLIGADSFCWAFGLLPDGRQSIYRDGNPKILILWPDKLLHCYQTSYSKDLLAYLQKEKKSTVRVTLQLRYSYGSIYGATILRFGDYHLRDELSELRQDGNGDCMKHLEEYAEPPGLGERHQCCDPIRRY